MPGMRIVTLLTDFGTADGYVGEMKGVIATEAPGVQLVDITHDIPAQDVDGARLSVARYWRRFPAGTIHLIVVDPGVGGARAPIAVESEGRWLVGPDNGVLSPALLHPGARWVELPIPAGAAATFHGRDVFAPAAAALARGAPLDDIGRPRTDPVIRRTPEAVRAADGSVSGVVISIDRFGNAITNLVAARGGTIRVAGRMLPVRRTYSDAARGEVLALVGSNGLVEVAVREGNAAAQLGLERGMAVSLVSG